MENKFRFYNTLSRTVENFVPNEEGKVAMYTCGPTVYHLNILVTCVVTLWKTYWRNPFVTAAMM